LGFAARSNLDIVGLALNVGSDRDAVPNPGIVGIGHVAVVDPAISSIDESVFGKPNSDRGLGEIIDVLGTDSYQTVEICRGRARLELEAQCSVGGQRGFTALPAVAGAHVSARFGTHEGGGVVPDFRIARFRPDSRVARLRPESRSPCGITDLSARTGAGKDQKTDE
jgi:hypothetical protein